MVRYKIRYTSRDVYGDDVRRTSSKYWKSKKNVIKAIKKYRVSKNHRKNPKSCYNVRIIRVKERR